MKCPVCHDIRMREVLKNGVHIDVCPECKGVWLDRGELEKLTSDVHDLRKEYDSWYDAPPGRPPHGYGGSDYDRHYPKYKKKKHTVFDLFDDLF